MKKNNKNKYIVKIDRNSIKKNPKAGQRWGYHVPGNTCTEPDGSISRHVTYVESLSLEPKVFYEYEDTEIECKYCKSRFDYKDLLEDECYDEDENEEYSVSVCPYCNKTDPCELEFENITKVLEKYEWNHHAETN